jgi:hypothetical protein
MLRKIQIVTEILRCTTMAGYDIAKLNAAICNTYTANMLLQRFMAIVKEQV